MHALKMTLITAGSLALAVGIGGCSSGSSAVMLDPSATLALEGAPIVRQAPDNGEVTVFDLNQQKAVFSGRVKKSEIVTVDPSARRIMIGDEIAVQNLQGGDELQISFQPGM